MFSYRLYVITFENKQYTLEVSDCVFESNSLDSIIDEVKNKTEIAKEEGKEVGVVEIGDNYGSLEIMAILDYSEGFTNAKVFGVGEVKKSVEEKKMNRSGYVGRDFEVIWNDIIKEGKENV